MSEDTDNDDSGDDEFTSEAKEIRYDSQGWAVNDQAKLQEQMMETVNELRKLKGSEKEEAEKIFDEAMTKETLKFITKQQASTIESLTEQLSKGRQNYASLNKVSLDNANSMSTIRNHLRQYGLLDDDADETPEEAVKKLTRDSNKQGMTIDKLTVMVDILNDYRYHMDQVLEAVRDWDDSRPSDTEPTDYEAILEEKLDDYETWEEKVSEDNELRARCNDIC